MVPNTLPIRVCLLACLVLGYRNTSVHAEFTRHYCGKELSDTLSALCHGHYAPYNQINTADEGTFDNEPIHDEMANIFGLGSLSRSSTLGPARSRDKRGVVEECCINECSINDLKEYCEDE